MAAAPRKVYVVPVAGREPEIEQIKKLVRAGGAEVVCDKDPIDQFEHCVEDADVVVILICPETVGDKVIAEIVELARKLGKRVIAVWSGVATGDALPTPIHQYGEGAVRVDAAEIEGAICRDETIWNTPDGKPRKMPPTPRHKGH